MVFINITFLTLLILLFSPWSTGRSADTGWPDSGAVDTGAPDLKDAQWPTPPAQPTFTDLVPEFEPGKPWKVFYVYNYFVLVFFCEASGLQVSIDKLDF